MKRLYFIALLTFFSPFIVQARDQGIIDSLNAVIEEAKHDTTRCDAYLAWGGQVYLNNPDTALILWQAARDLAKQNLASVSSPSLERKYLSSLASALNNTAYIHTRKGDNHKGLDHYHRSLEIYEELEDKNGMASSLNNIGYVYNNLGDIPKALQNYLKSLKIDEELDNQEGIANSLNNIGNIYENQGKIKKALEYYHNSLKIKEEINDKLGIANSFNNIAGIYIDQGDIDNALEYYHKCLSIKEKIEDEEGIATTLSNIGFLYKSQNDNPKALEFYQKSLVIREEIENKDGIANSLNNIGSIYDDQGDIPKALEYYHKSLIIREEIGNKDGVANSLNNIGSIEFEHGSLKSASNYGLRGLKIAREIGSPDLILHNSSLLSKVAKKQGNYEEALEMYELHIQMRDSIKNEETQKATIRQQTKYEFEKAALVKEQEEREAGRLEREVRSRRDNLQYSIVLICLLVIGGFVAMLGRMSLPERVAEGLIFFAFLLLFEFVLVLADPYVEDWTGGAPGLKLMINAGVAALIFPAHAFFESKMKRRLVKTST